MAPVAPSDCSGILRRALLGVNTHKKKKHLPILISPLMGGENGLPVIIKVEVNEQKLDCTRFTPQNGVEWVCKIFLKKVE